jgi:tetratricopeptide (TPR) repeat protein
LTRALLILLCAMPLAAQAPKQRGIAAREAGRLAESSALLTEAAKASPKDPEIWWYLGLNAYDEDQHKPCAEAFARVVALDAKNAGAHAFLGLCAFRLGQWEPALAHIIAAKRAGLAPGTELDRVARYHYAMLLNKAGQFEAAASPLAEMARTEPDAPMLEELSGINALRLTMLPFEITAELRRPVSLAGRATMLAWNRKSAEAREAASELLREFPRRPNAHYLMGWLLLLGQDEGAMAEFEKELAISPGHVQARLQFAYEALRRGENERGLPYAREAARQAPKDFTARNIHGRLLLAAGAIDAAIPELEAAVKLAPSSPEGHFALANAYQRAGRKAEAEKHRAIFKKLDAERAAKPIPGVQVKAQ